MVTRWMESFSGLRLSIPFFFLNVMTGQHEPMRVGTPCFSADRFAILRP